MRNLRETVALGPDVGRNFQPRSEVVRTTMSGRLAVRKLVLYASLLLLGSACAGCGGNTSDHRSPGSKSCSDPGFADAVSARLAALERAVLRVDAGHGNVSALGSAAPRLVAAAKQASEAAKGNAPCRPRLVKARALLLVATRGLLSAGRALEPIEGSSKTGEVFSESQFLTSWYAGTQEFQEALASLRAAGVRGLVSATDGKGIFIEAGCAACHTLAAAGASATIGPNLDDLRPSKPAVVEAVTHGIGAMLSFEGKLSAEQIHTVAQFVSQNAGK